MRPVATFPSVLLLLATFVLFGAAQLAPVYKPFGGGGEKDGKSIEQQEDPRIFNDVPRPQVDVGGPTAFVTKTVYGFLDFTTTVGSTIMVFSPKSESKGGEKKVKPSTTRFTVEATPTPQLPRAVPTTQRTVIASPILLQSSLSETFSASQPVATTSTRAAKVVTAIPEPVKEPGPRPFRFGKLRDGKRPEIREPRRPSTIGERKRFDVPQLTKGKTETETEGGSTIVPITVTGTGLRGSTTSQPPRVTPSEVVVTANQGFASLSLIDRFTNAISSSPNKNNDNEDLPKPQSNYAINPDPIITNDGLPPTGLVTTLGGTIVNSGLTTVHETSVIGTYIKGQYAQVLLSTSRIFQSSPSVDLLSPGFETVKSVIKGSATQFIKPEMTSILPLEGLFTASNGERNGRLDDQPAFFKRRGPTRPQFKDDPFVDGLSEDDLQRSGTDLRPSFRPVASGLRRKPERTTVGEVDPTTFRPKFTPASSSFRFDSLATRTPASRTSPPGDRSKRPFVRRRPGAGSNRPKLTTNRRIVTEKKKEAEESIIDETTVKPTPTLPAGEEDGEETLQVDKSKVGDVWIEVATIRTMHAFRVGAKKNTRFVTFTKTFTHAIEPTSVPKIAPQLKHSKELQTQSYKQDDLDATPLFENILEAPRDIATLPPIDIGDSNLNALLQTVTESLSTTETMLKTSVLPVMKHQLTMMHTLTQTYLITRIVTAIKTIPPVEAFDFIPENSLNEFNDKLLAEGTENDESLLPGEMEYDENSGTRVKPPPGFKNDPALAELVGGQFNPDALEQQLHPELSAALRGSPQLASGQKATPETAVTQATPQLSPEHLQQLAYLQLMNPYAFGGFPGALQPQVTVTSSPVTITTDVTTTTTRVLRVIFNARPIYTTLTSTEVVRTTLTTYESATVSVTPQLPFGGFPFPGMPFAAG